MIFAAGLGTRLGELGRDTPKALIEIAGQTMLERTARQLVRAGADRIIVNVHHHAERIEAYVAAHDLGAEVVLSREPDGPLETGGGLVWARDLFRLDAPILLHNVDVITAADLGAMVAAHRAGAAGGAGGAGGPGRAGGAGGALATLAVNVRETQRYLLFDDTGLFGREDRRHGLQLEARPPHGAVRRFAFAGIHVCSPALLDLVTERGAFPIMDVYLRLAAAGHVLAPWPLPEGGLWLEIGNAERLAAARLALKGASE